MTAHSGTPTESSSPARVVVGVDGSPHSHLALEWAAFLAAPLGASLQAIIAWQQPASYGLAVPQWDPEADMAQVLEDTLHTVFGDQPPAPVQAEVREGGAARILIDAAHGARMLVVGSRGHGGFAGLLLGSVSASVAEHAPCPVLVVHGDERPPGAAPR